MIAARFRQVGWTAGVAVAALCCYLASQWVAAERGALATVDRQIADTGADIQRLQTEIAARSRMGQIERWNSEAFALQAAAPRQYVADGVQLASLAGGRRPAFDPAAAQARGTAQLVGYVKPAAPVAPPPGPAAAPPEQPLLRVATYVRPHHGRLDAAETPVVKVALGAAVDVPVTRVRIEPLEQPPVPAPAPTVRSRRTPLGLLPDDLGRLAAAERSRPAAK